MVDWKKKTTNKHTNTLHINKKQKTKNKKQTNKQTNKHIQIQIRYFFFELP